MRLFSTLTASLAAAVLLASAAWADATLTPAFQGPFNVPPAGPHQAGVSGTMLLFPGADGLVNKVTLKLNAPVFGRSQLDSSAVAASQMTLNPDTVQLGLVFKLVGPPHPWHYVLVANGAGGGPKFDGTLYSVAGAPAAILAVLKQGITTAPDSWNQIGTVQLQKP